MAGGKSGTDGNVIPFISAADAVTDTWEKTSRTVGNAVEQAETAVISVVAIAEGTVNAGFSSAWGLVRDTVEGSVSAVDTALGSGARAAYERAGQLAATGLAHAAMGEQMAVDALKEPLYWGMEHSGISVPLLAGGALLVSPVSRGFLLSRIFGRVRSGTQLTARARREAELMRETARGHGQELAKLAERLGPAVQEYRAGRKKLAGALRELESLDTRVAHDVERNAGLLLRMSGIPRTEREALEAARAVARENREALAQTRHQLKDLLRKTSL